MKSIRNCSPTFLRAYTNEHGIPCRLYLDELTGVILVAMDFEEARCIRERKRQKREAVVIEFSRAYHKGRRL
jgi:hypothetical protein